MLQRVVFIVSLFVILNIGKTFAKSWPVELMYYDDCPLTCNRGRPGFIGEVLELALNKHEDKFHLKHNKLTYEKYLEKEKEKSIDIKFSLFKKDNQYIYTEPIGRVFLCAYGEKYEDFTKEKLKQRKISYRNSEIYLYKFKYLMDLIVQNKFYIDRYVENADNVEMFNKVISKKYDWYITFDSFFNFLIKDQHKDYKSIREIGCLGEVKIYLAINRAHLRSWELKNLLNEFFKDFLNSKDYRSLRDFYKIHKIN